MSPVKGQVIGRGRVILHLVALLGAVFIAGFCVAVEKQPVSVHQLKLDGKGHFKPTDRQGEIQNLGNRRFRLQYEDATDGVKKTREMQHPELDQAFSLMDNAVVQVASGNEVSYGLPVSLMVDLVPETPQFFIYVEYLTGRAYGEYLPLQSIAPAPADVVLEAPESEYGERPRWREIKVDALLKDPRTGAETPVRRDGYIFLHMNPRMSVAHPSPELLFYYTMPTEGGGSRYIGTLVPEGEYSEANVILSVPSPLVVHPQNQKVLTVDTQGVVLDVIGEKPRARLQVKFRGEPLASYTVPVSAVKGSDGLLFCRSQVVAKTENPPEKP